MKLTQEEFEALKAIYGRELKKSPSIHYERDGAFTICNHCHRSLSGWKDEFGHDEKCSWLNRMKPFDPLLNLVEGDYHD